MIICKQEENPNRKDVYSRDGFSALCQKDASWVDQRTANKSIP